MYFLEAVLLHGKKIGKTENRFAKEKTFILQGNVLQQRNIKLHLVTQFVNFKKYVLYLVYARNYQINGNCDESSDYNGGGCASWKDIM